MGGHGILVPLEPDAGTVGNVKLARRHFVGLLEDRIGPMPGRSLLCRSIDVSSRLSVGSICESSSR